jgi:cytochrome P450
MAVNPHADEFDEAEWRLRQDIEAAIEQAADCIHDSTQWWATNNRHTLIGMIVVAAKDYKNRLNNAENTY